MGKMPNYWILMQVVHILSIDLWKVCVCFLVYMMTLSQQHRILCNIEWEDESEWYFGKSEERSGCGLFKVKTNIWLRNWGEPRNTSVMISGLWVENWITNIPKTKQYYQPLNGELLILLTELICFVDLPRQTNIIGPIIND